MRLSIVVPVYNVDAYLRRCLRSLLDQDLDPSDYEVLVINDGSEDGSLEIATSFALNNRNVMIHSQENLGHSAARNAGISLATGKYIYFVDSDDYIASNVLGGLVGTMDREQLQILAFGYSRVGPDDEASLARADYAVFQDVAVSSGIQFMATHNHPNTVWYYILDRGFLGDSGIRFEVGRLVEDALFTANVISAASRLAYVPIDVYRYVQRPGSAMRTRSAAHTTKLVAGYEGVVFGLEELRQRLQANGTASTALVNRLVIRQQSFVFFLIARLIRSEVPMRPILPEALERLRAIDMYPLTRFPGGDHKGLHLTLLTMIFNRAYLLYPFSRVVRLLYRLRRQKGT